MRRQPQLPKDVQQGCQTTGYETRIRELCEEVLETVCKVRGEGGGGGDVLDVVIAASQGGGVQEGDPGCVRHPAAAEVQHHREGEAQGALLSAHQDSVLSGLQVRTSNSPPCSTVGHFLQNCSGGELRPPVSEYCSAHLRGTLPGPGARQPGPNIPHNPRAAEPEVSHLPAAPAQLATKQSEVSLRPHGSSQAQSEAQQETEHSV